MAVNNSLNINTSTPLDLTRGGSSADLTASIGGLIYSTASAMAVLSGTATAFQIPLSGASGAPSWSTATYLATLAANGVLYASASNTLAQLSVVNSAVLLTNASGVPSFSASLTNGQLIIGSTGSTPSIATLTAGTGISIGNTAGAITITATGAAAWVDQTTTPVTMTTNTGYTNDGGVLITFSLPTTSAVGDFVEINGKSSDQFTIAQAAGQRIHFGVDPTTSGATGTISSTGQYDNIRLRCITANTIWTVVNSQGNFTIV